MKKYILAIDEGTTGSTALIIDGQTCRVISKSNHEFSQIYPKPRWVEHNLDEIWESTTKSIKKAIRLAKIKASSIEAIGITNQRETTCAFSKKGKAIQNAIVWQDRRTEEFCKNNKTKYSFLIKKTGLPLDAYFSATKMNWLLNQNEKVKKAAQRDDLCLGTIDTFLLYKLTNSKSFFTETTNASRTLLMDLETGQWDNALLNFFGIEERFLPKIKNSIDHFGITENLDFLPDGIPIMCILGDQQAALFGQAGINPGDFKCTYGTGSFALVNTGEKILYSTKGLLTTVAYSYKNKNYYALEGSCYIAGAAVQWLRDNCKFIKKSSDIEALAKRASDLSMDNILFLPFFTGIASPHWVSNAKAAIVGLTRDTGQAQIARACLEGVCLSISDLIQAFEELVDVRDINVDGGAAENNYWMQMQSNFLFKPVTRPKIIETTAYGVALGALVGMERVKLADVKKLWKKDVQFRPQKKTDYHNQKKLQWNEVIKNLYLNSLEK